MPLIDTHCHLDFSAYDGLRDEIVAEATASGVTRILNPGTDLERSRAAIALAETYPAVFAAVGVHPNSTTDFSPAHLAALRDLAAHPKVDFLVVAMHIPPETWEIRPHGTRPGYE